MTFEDNGIGLDTESNKEKLFGMYRRFHNNTEGKGLGLYLVKNQIEMMQGRIKMKSEVGKGTIITILFPKYKMERREESVNDDVT